MTVLRAGTARNAQSWTKVNCQKIPMSGTLSANCGSLETLKCATRCGCNPEGTLDPHDGGLR